ncbi:glycosyltransferase family 4 protein [Bacillus sp. AFS037270]|uniref:glycosyltransferase family 4 protein n=1 Tax=Bacillus sp. AFS037270 TaxID=2033499 RepID=UPI00159BBE42|nr:glycosyltransferase family 4 protein [Bacillus sp. AFS037270]
MGMKKNVVIIHSLYYPTIVGGAEISTKILAETLSAKYNISVIAVGGHKSTDGIYVEELNNVKIYRIPYNNLYWIGVKKNKSLISKLIWHIIDIYNPVQYKLIKKILGEIKPDIIHTQNLPGLSLSVWKVGKDLNIPIVHTLRDYSLLSPVESKIFSRFYKMISISFSRYVSVVTGISNFILEQHLSKGMFVNSRNFVIPNVVESDVIISNKKIEDTPVRVAFFGQLASNKGLEYLINAIREIDTRIVSTLEIYGDGPLKEDLMKLSIGDTRIKFNGKIPKEQIQLAMSDVDLVIVPSTWEEPFGRVIIEAYQVGTPVLASNVGGIPEIIINNSHLFEPQNIDSIKESILSYNRLSVYEKRQLSEQCIKYSQSFNTENLLIKHETIYERLIKSRRKEKND